MQYQHLYRLFRRALRACQLYPPSSPVREEAAGELLRTLAPLLAARPEGVSIAFVEDGVYIDQEQVDAAGAGRGEPAALGSLFHVGVRELRLLPGLDAPELLRLIAPMARAQQGRLNPTDEDLGVLLWEADLRHVGYLLYEAPADELSPPEEEASVPGSAAPSVEEFLDEPGPGFELAPLSGWGLSEEERLQVLAAHRREEERSTPVKFARLLIEIIRLGITDDERSALQEVWKDRVAELIEAGRHAQVTEVARALQAASEDRSTPASSLAGLEAWLFSPETVATFFAAPPASEEDRQGLESLVLMLPPRTVVEQAAGLAAGTTPDAAGAALRQRLRVDPMVRRLCLADPRAAVIRVALESIDPAGDEVRLVREVRQTAAAGLRILAVQALGRGEGNGILSGLVDALGDPEEQVRIAAALALAGRPAAEGLDPLLRMIASSLFHARSATERRAIYVAAGRLAPQEVWPLLAALAEKRSGWWRRQPTVEAQIALAAIAELGPLVHALARARWGKRADRIRGASLPGVTPGPGTAPAEASGVPSREEAA